jgi:lipopolysaccharide export system protein LptA
MVKKVKKVNIPANIYQLRNIIAGLSIVFFLSVFVSSFSQEKTKVQFSAATTEYDENMVKDTRRLIGDVIFTHGGAKMYCDSAYFYSERNSLDAFGHVFINQGDTVHLYGDYLYYDGNTRIAKVKHHVRLKRGETLLTTDSLDYDIGKGIGYYTDHADIVDKENHLESKKGYYYTRIDFLAFLDSVIIINPEYKIYSDTLKYNTISKIAYFFGPTEIISDSSYIYCERGWYNTQTDISQLNQHALVRNKNQTVKGDSLYYEKLTGYGRAVNNVEIIDADKNIILKGNNGVYYEQTKYARMTDRAEFVQISEIDTLFLHADTLLSELDTSGFKIIKAYYKVRIFRNNMQGKCDSLAYSFADSAIRLYNVPVLWSEDQQLTADYMEIQTENQKAKTMFMRGAAFITAMKDTSKYDQIKGKNMTCHFRNNEMYRVDVNGNGQTVYYPPDDENKGFIGVNKAECSDLVIFIVDGKVSTIKFLKKPDATLYPIETAPINELTLKGFVWLDDIRPKNKSDIFRK